MRRASFARKRGGAGGRQAPPHLSVPFGDLDTRGQAEQDADMSPLRIMLWTMGIVFAWTCLCTLGKAIIACFFRD